MYLFLRFGLVLVHRCLNWYVWSLKIVTDSVRTSPGSRTVRFHGPGIDSPTFQKSQKSHLTGLDSSERLVFYSHLAPRSLCAKRCHVRTITVANSSRTRAGEPGPLSFEQVLKALNQEPSEVTCVGLVRKTRRSGRFGANTM